MHSDNRTRRSRFTRGRHWAVRHGFEWDISWEDYQALLAKPCDYCGTDLSHETGRGLDRVDASVGYLLSNVVPCCGRCNKVRGHEFTPDQMRVMMGALKKMA